MNRRPLHATSPWLSHSRSLKAARNDPSWSHLRKGSQGQPRKPYRVAGTLARTRSWTGAPGPAGCDGPAGTPLEADADDEAAVDGAAEVDAAAPRSCAGAAGAAGAAEDDAPERLQLKGEKKAKVIIVGKLGGLKEQNIWNHPPSWMLNHVKSTIEWRWNPYVMPILL